jgi:hypothetical protein
MPMIRRNAVTGEGASPGGDGERLRSVVLDHHRAVLPERTSVAVPGVEARVQKASCRDWSTPKPAVPLRQEILAACHPQQRSARGRCSVLGDHVAAARRSIPLALRQSSEGPRPTMVSELPGPVDRDTSRSSLPLASLAVNRACLCCGLRPAPARSSGFHPRVFEPGIGVTLSPDQRSDAHSPPVTENDRHDPASDARPISRS